MDEINSTSSTHIDDLLDQVAIALSDGKNEEAAHLLPEILQSGDEVQRLMAESYLMQLDALQALEEQEASLANNDEPPLIDTSPPPPLEEVVEVVNSEASDSYVLTEKKREDVFSSTPVDEDVLPIETLEFSNNENSAFFYEVASSSIEESSDYVKDKSSSADANALLPPEQTLEASYSTNIIEATEDNVAVNEADEHLTASTSEAKEELFSENHDNTFVSVPDETATSSGIVEITENASQANNVVSLSPEQEELYTALAQAEMLVADGEYETAELALESVLYCNDDELRSQAKALILQIDFAKSSFDVTTEPDSTTLSNEPKTQQDNSLIDAIFDNDYEGFSAHKDDYEQSADNLSDTANNLPHDGTKQVIESPIEPSEKNLSGPSLSEETETDESVLSTLNQLQLTAGSSVAQHTDLIGDFHLPVEETVTTEIFYDDDDTNNMLAPIDALQISSGTSGDTIETTVIGDPFKQHDTLQQRQGFFIGDTRIMIDFADGSELTEMPKYFRVPNSPLWLMGVTNLHGVVVPIFNLHQYLHLGEPQNSKQMLLVLQHNEKAIGILINGLPQRLSFNQSQKMALNTAPKSLRSHIHGAYLINEDLWFDLDIETLTQALENAM